MNFTPADIAAMLDLNAMGEAVTLSFSDYSVTVNALVVHHDERTDPLATGNARHWIVLTMSATDAADITPDWTVVVQGQRREVLESIAQGNGFTDVYLGDSLGDDSC